jgi:signal transduction histidine kinase
VDRSERLIAGLLMLARSEAAAGRGEPVDVAVLAGDCITDLRVQAEQAQVEVRDDLEPAWTRGEPALIERLVANLIDNGVHHNEPGGFLEVSTRVRDGRVQLLVSNGGPLIDPEDAAQLTEPFRRLDRSVDGLGLGLSIVRSVVDAHGGSTTVTARPEGGLTVAVELPAQARAPAAKAPRALTQS